MDEQNPETPPAEIVTSPPGYKDRSTAMVVFGILTIMMGCLNALFIPLMLLGQVTARNQGSPTPAILPVIVVYGILAVVLVWLGIGSVMARRWARALLLIFSWSWLVMGIFVSIFMMLFMLKTLMNSPSGGMPEHPATPVAAIGVVVFTMAVIFGGVFIVLPAIWTFFYNSRHVKATCEARDPVIRWTDACPLPVLGFSLWLAFSSAVFLLTLIIGHGVMPFFGMFLTGVPGRILCLTLALVWGYAAWSLYKLKPQGWWVIFIAVCVVFVSGVLTFSRHDMLEMYRQMNYSEAQIDQIQKLGALSGKHMTWLPPFGVAPFLVYLFFIRKFIFRKSQEPPSAAI